MLLMSIVQQGLLRSGTYGSDSACPLGMIRRCCFCTNWRLWFVELLQLVRYRKSKEGPHRHTQN
jgi:hypothetical protein